MYISIYIFIFMMHMQRHTYFFTQTLEWLKYKPVSFPAPWAISLGVSFPQLSQVPDAVGPRPSHHRKWEAGQEIPSVGHKGSLRMLLLYCCWLKSLDTLGQGLSDLVTLKSFKIRTRGSSQLLSWEKQRLMKAQIIPSPHKRHFLELPSC